MEDEVKPDITTREDSIPAAVDSTSDVAHVYAIKREFSLSEPHSCGEFLEHAVVEHTNTSIQSLNLKIKSEVPDLKYSISSNNDIHIKLERVVSEEVHIKCEIDDSLLQTNVQQHLNNHTPGKPFQCNTCDFKCLQVDILNQHTKIHTEKFYKCGLCDYRSKSLFNLDKHTKTHTGEKPFKCCLCNYRCIENGQLKRHIRTHTGEKPFKCTACDYKCIAKNTLQRHAIIHTTKNTFQCSVCNYRCLKRGDLQKHFIKTHSGE